MPLHVYGLGLALPPFSLTQEHAAAAAAQLGAAGAEQQRQLRALYRLTRVRARYSVLLESDGREGLPRQSFFPPAQGPDDRGPSTSARMARYETDAPALAVGSSRAALDASGRDGRDVTHLVTVSCTGFAAPGLDIALIRRLGLPSDVARTHVGFMGCHGALNGLRVAAAYATGRPDACVLVCAVELCTLHYRYGWSADQMVANALFADGSAALVGGSAPRAPGGWVLDASGSTLLEDSAELMTWRVGDHGFDMTLSARVPSVIRERLRPWLDRWLAASGLRIEQVASWALHPGGPRILEACAESIGLPREAYAVSQEVLAGHGNMSSPTILFILDRLRSRDAPRPCVAIGFGPGLAVETALFR